MTTRSSHFRPFITFNVRQFLYEITSHPQLAKFAFALPGNSVFFTLRPDQSDDHGVCIICPTNCGACAGKSNLTASEVSQVGCLSTAGSAFGSSLACGDCAPFSKRDPIWKAISPGVESAILKMLHEELQMQRREWSYRTNARFGDRVAVPTSSSFRRIPFPGLRHLERLDFREAEICAEAARYIPVREQASSYYAA